MINLWKKSKKFVYVFMSEFVPLITFKRKLQKNFHSYKKPSIKKFFHSFRFFFPFFNYSK